MEQRLYKVEHLRAGAAIMVMISHAAATTEFQTNHYLFYLIDRLLSRFGNSGVILFFVLSGFIFTLITNAGERSIRYGAFLQSRLLRNCSYGFTNNNGNSCH